MCRTCDVGTASEMANKASPACSAHHAARIRGMMRIGGIATRTQTSASTQRSRPCTHAARHTTRGAGAVSPMSTSATRRARGRGTAHASGVRRVADSPGYDAPRAGECITPVNHRFHDRKNLFASIIFSSQPMRVFVAESRLSPEKSFS